MNRTPYVVPARRTTARRGFVAAVCVLMLAPLGWVSAPTARAADDVDIDYVPPTKDAPARRLGGASRGGPAHTHGGAAEQPVVSVLAPGAKLGQTSRESPVLYWYLSKDTPSRVQMTIKPIDPANPAKPQAELLELTVKGPHKAGLHRLDLAKPGDEPAVKLQPGRQYVWTVEIVEQDRAGSANPGASCRFDRAELAGDAAKAVAAAQGAQKAAAYAKAGMWFDALAALNDAIDAKKDDPEAAAKLRAARRKLLQAQGLIEDEHGHITEAPQAARNGGR